MTQPLKNKVALITGAGRGIGKAIAIAYAQAGAAIVCAARTQAQIEQTVSEIEQHGGRAVASPTDVTQEEAIQAMVQATVEAFGGLDILVINAGGDQEHRPIAESESEAWRQTIDLNLNAAYFCAKAAIPYLKQSEGGKIITIGSGLGHRGRSNNAAYSCAKAGLWMFTRLLAQELWPDGISVNELIPGPVKTNLTQAQSDQGGGVFNISSEWVKEPKDVAPLALFLATQPSTGPTAQSFSLMRRDG